MARMEFESFPNTIFQKVIRKEAVTSTNSLALSSADKGEREGLVVIANSQTSGRGRLGRTWYSPPDSNIYMSLLLRPSLDLHDVPFITLLSAVGVCQALRSESGLDIRIKWPNDMVLNGKKVGGILTETRIEGTRITTAVVGIGINVLLRKEAIPEEIREIATSLFIETGREFAREDIIEAILTRFDLLYRDAFPLKAQTGIDPPKKRALLEKWRSLDTVLGERISVQTSHGIITGRATDIDESGMLIILTDTGKLRHLSSGDVTVCT